MALVNYSTSPTTFTDRMRSSTFSTEFASESSTVDFRGVSTPDGNSTAGDNTLKLNVAYTAAEGVVALLAMCGNALVVYVFCKNRSLRRYRNYYIFALAIADFLVGLLGIPFAILANMGLPRNLYGCLFTVSILMVLCTISILCLVAVSIDRYWATTNPFAYYRHMTTSTAVGIILSCWIVGAVIGFLPLFGWYNLEGWYKSEYCYFTDVMDYNYLVFLYFATIVFPALLMGCFYGYIYHVVLIKIRQKGNIAPQQIRRPSEQSRTGSLNSDNRGASQIARIIVSEKRREAKAAHKLGIIVLFFMICWMPLYTINCVQAFCPKCSVPIELLNFTIILSHANSSLNPLLYAYHLKEFRIAMKNALLVLFDKVCCGLMGDRVAKDAFGGPLSRSQTLPSLAHAATIAGSASKVSIKFRRSPRTNEPQSRSLQISPTRSQQSNAISPALGQDRSLTSLSIGSNTSPNPSRNPNGNDDSTVATNGTKLRFMETIKCSLGVKKDDIGIEIHVVNIDSDVEGECKKENNGNIAPTNTNDKDSIEKDKDSDKSPTTMTTPL